MGLTNSIRLLGHIPTNRPFGEKNPNWKNGIWPVHLKIRDTREYKIWRMLIFERDNYSCVNCGVSKVYLNADHYPLSFAQIMFENNIKTVADALKCSSFWDINNGRTLCRPCHIKTETWGKNFKPMKTKE